ncbi:hypothetical protein AD006_31270 (plasmid) [Pseudonocardia sp. EC080610-09]|uniref:DUF3159 domain-containing protein n=1 Tax=unclassified Pseudonocardia TaxID=2619320 RepID=UPI0007069430|nr:MULTISPECIES: DUF3159 domain-containing protein [unclassified Pseudonocardia]ALL79659.1 hypothetical protein AD006_31270 [Pseudonocardia sp. EC080610-09]ALL85384.1 hypothetical protein AD017_29965 [Pseudonocardia sp. EC080619-01]
MNTEPARPVTVGSVARQAIERSGGVSGIVVTAAPIVAFVAVNALSGPGWAAAAVGVTAVVVLGLRLARRKSLRGPLGGLGVAVVCALVAVATGEARAFFLLPSLLPAVLLVLFVGSVIVGRPATGILLNRLAGGPTDWRTRPRLMRVYVLTTLAGIGIHITNLTVRIVLYLADQPAWLAVVQIAVGPVVATLVVTTLIAARRVMRRGAPPVPDKDTLQLT